MADESKIKEFPDISNKLAAPTKKSLFERQKAEAEAKRQREAAETAAVYEDFVKSFDDADGTLPSAQRRRPSGVDLPGPERAGGFGGPPKRQLAGPPTGPAGRAGHQPSRAGFSTSGVGSLGAPPNLRKRAHDGSHPSRREGHQSLFAFEDSSSAQVDAKSAFQSSDDDEDREQEGKKAERAAPKPTLHLSSLPPGTSPAVIKSLLRPSLTVDAVRILPPTGSGSVERKSLSAIVTLAKDTPANEIDTAVNGLQNRYLGWGYTLAISRHLSSAALNAGASVQAGLTSALSSLPFGAKPVPTGPTGPMNRAPPSNIHRGGFAPPTSYGPNQYGRGAPLVQVSVNPPLDLKQLKLIHKTLEALLAHGPEFEALLMSRPEVQRGERWAWIWDPRSPGGVWYRWRLWQILSGSGDRRKGMPEFVFDGGAAWVPLQKNLRFEYATRLDEFVSDSDYDSSEDEDSGDDDHHRRHHHGHGPPPQDAGTVSFDKDGPTYLNPLKKAKLTHLLARLPTTNGRLRKGDVARVTAFAIEHAGEGADEVVDLIVSNIEHPFCMSHANPDRTKEQDEAGLRNEDETADDKDKPKEKEDPSPPKLIGLYVVSDILSSSSTSGVRHAWRYRQLFETCLKQRRVFEGLGRLEKKLRWGRMRAEKWKRSLGNVLSLWEGWCVFPQASQEHFASVFANPPPTAAEEAEMATASAQQETSGGAKSRWKTVDVTASAADPARPADLDAPPEAADVDGEPMEGVDGEPMEDVDGDLMEDVDGEPMEDVDGEPMDTTAKGGELDSRSPAQQGDHRTPIDTSSTTGSLPDPQAAAGPPRRRRPKAEDMFADSDED